MNPVFLTAEWRDLVMLNYAVDPTVFVPYVPNGTELVRWDGTAFVSLVAFSFLNTRVKGVPIPLRRDFEEINLRFYVRAKGPEGWRRGVVFVREVVPRFAIASVARWLYNENYWGCSSLRDGSTVEYRVEHPQWKVWETATHFAHGDFGGFYGHEFAESLAGPPISAFVADGSPVKVRKGGRLAVA